MTAGLLIAFLASRVLANLDHANGHVAREASAVRESVLLAEALPVGVRDAVRGAVKTHLRFVETQDCPAMAERRATLERSPSGLGEAIMALLSFQPATRSQQLAELRALIALEQALGVRRDRIVLSQAAIAPSQWLAIVILVLLIFLTIAIVHIDRPATIVANLFIFSTAAAIFSTAAACLVLLMINDRRFAAGGFTLQPTILREIAID